jgi:hypothetical protein
VVYGDDGAGLGTAGNQLWSQDPDAIAGVPEEGDTFGSSLGAGDFDGDGRDDLAIASPGETLGEDVSAGRVNVLYGVGASGLGTSGTSCGARSRAGGRGGRGLRPLGGQPASSGVYRIGFTNGTHVKVGGDYVSHTPIDRTDMNGTPKGEQYVIVAAAPGTIGSCRHELRADDDNNFVWIEHANGEWTKYTHFETGSVTDLDWHVGDHVDAGEPLGFEGDVGHANGEHLHFEVAVPTTGRSHRRRGLHPRQNRIPLICGIRATSWYAVTDLHGRALADGRGQG